MYTCPVCEYDALDDPPTDYNICSSCGTEFGYSDFSTSHEELRARWIASGSRWWSEYITEPSRDN